jgi:hypothetical protein
MNISKKPLSYRLALLVFLITSIPIFCISTWSYWSGNKALEEQFIKNFTWLASTKAEAIKNYLQQELTRADDFSSDAGIRALLVQYNAAELSRSEVTQKLNDLLAKKTNTLSNKEQIYETLVLDMKGQVLATTHPELAQTHQFSEEFIAKASKNNTLGDVYKHPNTGEIAFLAASAIQVNSASELGVGIMVNRISLKKLDEIMFKNISQFGESGEFYLVNSKGYRITESRFEKGLILQQLINTEPVKLFQEKHQAHSGTYLDYRNISVLGVSDAQTLTEAYDLGWLLLVEMDTSEVHAMATRLSTEITVFGIGTVLISLIIGIISGRIASAPIKIAIQEFLFISTELSTAADQHEHTAIQQAAAVNQTTATMDELSRSAQQSIFQADSANNTAQQAVSNAKEGAQAMQEMLQSIEELSSRVDNIGVQTLSLSEQTSQISHVTEAVKDIANQTNLLALNAAVEATRAGEHGKGFTVVSQEIRKLAEQSKKSAERISDLVNMIQKGTNATVLATEAGTQTTKKSKEQVKYAKQSFDTLSNSVNSIAEVLQQISLTSKQQSNATNQVLEAIAMINAGAQETAKGITQSKIANQTLNKTAEQLKTMF